MGSLRLSVWYAGDTPDLGGYRRRFAYRVVSIGPDLPGSFTGEDLHSGVGATPAAGEMLRTLAAFLGDAAERYQTGMRPPDQDYPPWLYEAAYLNSDELAMLALEDEPKNEPTSTGYVDVVFQQGEDAAEALAILDEHGEHAAIVHLAQWDHDREIDAAAPTGRIYERAPWASSDRTFSEGGYMLSYNLQQGYIGLVRELECRADGSQTASSRQLHDFGASHAARAVRASEVDVHRM